MEFEKVYVSFLKNKAFKIVGSVLKVEKESILQSIFFGINVF